MPRTDARMQAGFTFIEALIVLSIVLILIGWAVPAWTSALAATHTGEARTWLYDTIITAGNHATVTATDVVMCPSNDGVVCSGSMDWTPGWIAFADLDGNREHAPTETLLSRQGVLSGGTRLRSTVGRTKLVFQPLGGTPGSNVTLTLCDERGTAKATSVVMANSGRIRQDVPTQAAAAACVYGG